MYICDPCILAAVGVTASGRPAKDPALQPVPASSQLLCSFCGKARIQVQALVSAPARDEHQAPAICDECLGLCGEILSEQLR
ncbi:MAG TPA: ClpX C4-type zinc finger protein [Acidimicrobiales bacterium]|nr:ClpX C4-type zinc finger protein [Acidimicrobiales bacterium]